MAQLILLVVAAAWLAVLLPPMLRSRVENRPNSSVTDFRRQLTKLQNTATPPRGSARAMGRPLAPSPLQRPAAAGRPGQPMMRSGVTRHPAPSEVAVRQAAPAMAPHGPGRQYADPTGDQPRPRQHGDPTGGQQRFRSHGDPTGGQRRPVAPIRNGSGAMARPAAPQSDAKRRRSNVLFVLVVTTACTLFLAATTSSTVMLYLFALSFLGLCGYVYLLSQLRDRADAGYDGWLDQY